MSAPAQQGTTLYTKTPPTFANFRVVGGTWKESDAVQSEETMNENEETFNITFYNPGRNASCDLVSEGSQTPIAVGDELVETNGLLRTWIVTKADYTNFGTRALKAAISLIFRDGLQ